MNNDYQGQNDQQHAQNQISQEGQFAIQRREEIHSLDPRELLAKLNEKSNLILLQINEITLIYDKFIYLGSNMAKMLDKLDTKMKKIPEDYQFYANKSRELMMDAIDKISVVKISLMKDNVDIMRDLQSELQEYMARKKEKEEKEIKENKRKKLLFFGEIAAFAIVLLFSGIFSFKWFAESIRTKTEIRQQILDEFKADGQSIYEVKDYQQLEHNTEMMNKWMDAYPKEGREFMKFKKGFESR